MRLRDRLWFALLLTLDKLLGTRLAQREVNRRHEMLIEYQRRAQSIQQEVAHLETRLEALHLQLCLLYLRQRHMTDVETWLQFESGSSDEAGLDLLIEHLVKPRLAAIEMHETAPGHQVYHLHPDWEAIASAIGDASETLEPETISWLHQQVAHQSQPAV
jgi:hypothetical protein